MKRIITASVSLVLAMIIAVPVYAEDLPEINSAELAHEHQLSDWAVTQDPTCTAAGEEERHCTDLSCPDLESSIETRPVQPLGHDWSEWGVSSAATVFSGGINTQTCSRCGAQNNVATQRLKPYISWASKVKKIPRKSKVAFRVNLAKGDYVKKWKSSKKKVASVSKSGVVKGKKKGKTKTC